MRAVLMPGLRAGLLAAVVVVAGCAKGVPPAAGLPAPMAAIKQGKDQFLAYEHEARVELEGSRIGPRLQALAEACQKARFGDCTLLDMNEGDYTPRPGTVRHEAQIRVRLAPAGVAPFIALAGSDGRIANRSTQAEDLAVAVADTRRTQDRLQREYEKLSALQQRADVKVADLLAISQRMSEIESGLEAANRDAAQQRRRIDTQLVTVKLEPPSAESGRSEIGEALRDFSGVFTTSVAFVIRAVAALIPVGGVLALLGWGARALWRRRRRA
ncbi:DUF4349 domain-containing protein [Stenotrophomonas sp. 24(2023)]|uniref:DUF4349 domain-containing protein n=1 Tax=Stenotrophomonas sp. 24(2023) TaxID=3068324 RepID=UPI0027DFC697|nr:DUF4349 domain-containing protein [Stenotrophomonas sp. 24(2023)]WMJ68475.1 DUF4349 domain-containing protein [Stenotrophomonas sp. 24(2023)]